MPAKKTTKKKPSLMSRVKSANTLGKNCDVLKNSKFFIDEFYDTRIPALNIALSAQLDGGFSRGSTLIAGDSKTFKTMFMLEMAHAYLEANPKAIFVFYDVEFGTNNQVMESIGIDTSRVFHKPLMTVEDLKIDIVALLEEMEETDDIIIGIDSLGAIASDKELEDAKKGAKKADMTRAKQLKSFWRLVNPYLNIKKIPMIAIGQTYGTQELYSKEVINGGKGMVYFPNNIWMVGKEQIVNKTTKEYLGSFFNVVVFKGRLVKERSKFPIEITFEDGINKYSALLDIALKLGYVQKPKNGWFTHAGVEKNYNRKQSSCPEFWNPILEDQEFHRDIKDLFSLGSLREVETLNVSVFDDDDVDRILGDDDDDEDSTIDLSHLGE